MKFSLETGHTALDLEIADEKILGILEGKDIPALGHDRVARIIGDGIRSHAPQDLAGKRIALIIPDDTRLWARGDRFVPVIIDALADAGANLEKITVIIALGTHKAIPESQFDLLCGKDTKERVKVVNAAGLDPGRLAAMGTTPAGTPLTVTCEAAQADHIVIFGGVLHHMLAGFGGGRKYILPGIAGNDAIQANHSLAMDGKGIPHPRVAQGICRGNPVSEDMAAGANLFLKGRTCTYAAVAANGRGEIFHAEAGGLGEVFDRGCREVDRACCVDIDQKADFIIFSAGGHRTDAQLYQATKALFNAVAAAKEGATLVFVAGCAAGVGNGDFADALNHYKTCPGELGRKLAAEFNMPAYVALRVMDMLHRFNVVLVSDLDQAATRELGFSHAHDVNKLVHRLEGRGYIIPFAENILPKVMPPQ
ncbi:MAG: nickel-dependent lactate racemase [Desulfobacter sp.]|nr:MAG: nickel-dependent lactate racemase [Desulfobacter sp.]